MPVGRITFSKEFDTDEEFFDAKNGGAYRACLQDLDHWLHGRSNNDEKVTPEQVQEMMTEILNGRGLLLWD